MKPLFPFLLGLLVLLVGCRPTAQKGGDDDDQPLRRPGVPTATFDTEQGLQIPDAMQKSIGMTFARVERKEAAGQKNFVFHVFREAGEDSLAASSYEKGMAYASAFVSPEDLDSFKKKPLFIANSAHPDHSLEIQLFRIDRSTESALGQAEVLVAIPDASGTYALNQTVSVIVSEEAIVRLIVPASSVLDTTDGKIVYRRVSADRFKRVPVETGIMVGDGIEIVSGIKEGDEVVAAPMKTLWLTELQLRNLPQP